MVLRQQKWCAGSSPSPRQRVASPKKITLWHLRCQHRGLGHVNRGGVELLEHQLAKLQPLQRVQKYRGVVQCQRRRAWHGGRTCAFVVYAGSDNSTGCSSDLARRQLVYACERSCSYASQSLTARVGAHKGLASFHQNHDQTRDPKMVARAHCHIMWSCFVLMGYNNPAPSPCENALLASM